MGYLEVGRSAWEAGWGGEGGVLLWGVQPLLSSRILLVFTDFGRHFGRCAAAGWIIFLAIFGVPNRNLAG